MRKQMALLVFLLAAVCPAALCETLSSPHVEIEYAGIDRAYPEAIAAIVETVREKAVADFGFDLPDRIRITIRCDSDLKVRLWTDGDASINLDIRSEADLHKPAETGVFNLYGFCHEVGHICMYRILRNRGWMTSDAAESWAHYFGSRMVDALWEEHGKDLWPDRYNYKGDGMMRFRSQINTKEPFSLAARSWDELAKSVNDDGIAPLFRAWDDAATDMIDPLPGLEQSMVEHAQASKLKRWLKKYGEVLIRRRERSPFKTETVAAGDLKGEAQELAHDDGTSAGRRSWPGSVGQAVRFRVNSSGMYLSEVKVFGSLYGRVGEDTFKLWLCDGKYRPFACHEFPFKKFSYAPQWTSLKIAPTLVPKEFYVVTCFDATAHKGVFMNYDAKGSGNSFSGVPGGDCGEWTAGDWMIRAVVAGK